MDILIFNKFLIIYNDKDYVSYEYDGKRVNITLELFDPITFAYTLCNNNIPSKNDIYNIFRALYFIYTKSIEFPYSSQLSLAFNINSKTLLMEGPSNTAAHMDRLFKKDNDIYYKMVDEKLGDDNVKCKKDWHKIIKKSCSIL